MNEIRIGAVINTTFRPGKGLLLGMERCVQEQALAHPGLVLRGFLGSAATTVGDLCEFAKSGVDVMIFCGIAPETLLRFLRECGNHPPVVLAVYSPPPEELWEALGDGAVVMYDNAAIGEKAADFFSSHGLRNFAFLSHNGYREDVGAQVRGAAFEKRLKDTLGEHINYKQLAYGSFARNEDWWEGADDDMGAWLSSLSIPCGLFVNGDHLAYKVASECARRDIRVPDMIEILGVDNREGFCEKADPTISSVKPDFSRFSAKAVDVALALVFNPQIRKQRHLSVVNDCDMSERGTTAVGRGYGHVAVRAKEFIRANACSGISVLDVAHSLGISRRTLEVRLKEATGKSVHHMIRDVKMEEVCRLLKETDIPISEVITKCGYALTTNAFVLFKKQYGMTMREFRKKHRQSHKKRAS